MKRLLILFSLILPLLLTGCRQEPAFVKPDKTPGGDDPVQTIDNDDADDVNWAAAMGYVFDSSVIPEIHIIVSQEQWDKLLAAFDRDNGTQ